MGAKVRAGYPSDVSDEEWAFVLPYLLLSREYTLLFIFHSIQNARWKKHGHIV